MAPIQGYRTLYTIKVEHDHFKDTPCTAIDCKLTPKGKELVRRRGMLFKQTAPSEWTLYFRSEPDTSEDILTIEFSVIDRKLLLYTLWPDFKPFEEYRLELPTDDRVIDVASEIHSTGMRRTIGSGNCMMSLRLNDAVVNAAEEGNPVQAVLHFKAL